MRYSLRHESTSTPPRRPSGWGFCAGFLATTAACSSAPIEDTEAPVVPDTDVVDTDTDTGGCPAPLTATVQPDRVLPWGVAQVIPAGGTGAYRFQLLAGDDDVSVTVKDGRVTAGGRAGDVIGVRVVDLGCPETVTVEVPVVPRMDVQPLQARVPPGTRIPIGVTGGLSGPTCTRDEDSAVGRLDGCTWVAEQPGTDRVVVRDAVAGTSVATTYVVEAGAELDVHGERWMIPEGSTFLPEVSGGSGHLRLTVVSGEAVEVVDGAVIAVESGSAEVLAEDVYTGQSQRVAVRVGAARVPDATPDGTLGNSGTLLGGFDLNEDGYDDVILGLPEANLVASGSGSLAVYLGGPDGLEAEPAQVFGWELGFDDEGGRAVAVGDLDGDGVADLAWTAELESYAGVQNGTVRLHRGLGDGRFDPKPWRVLAGINGDDRLGAGVAICDVDGDGRNDLAASAHQAEDRTAEVVRTNQGAVYVWRGEAGGLAPEPTTARYGAVPDGSGGWNTAANLLMGRTLAAGDLNGDGRCDLVASAESATLDGAGSDGVAWIYLGDPERGLGLSPARVVTWRGADTSVNLGRHLAIGDVDGDGWDDVAFSMYRHGSGDQGRVALYLGADLTGEGPAVFSEAEARVSVRGTGNAANVGYGVAMDDLDRDGFADLILGAPGEVPTGTTASAGQSWWIRGEDLNGAPRGADLTVAEIGSKMGVGTPGSRWGQMVGPGGDVDGTGDREIVVLAGRDHSFGVSLGALYTVGTFGVTRGPTPTVNLASQHGYGTALAWLDTTGDGAEDLVLGAQGYGVPGSGANAGTLFAFAGSRGDLAPSAYELRPFLPTLSEGDRLGFAVATTDFDGDGYPDLAVVSENDSKPTTYDTSVVNNRDCGTSRSGAGAVLIHRGGPSGIATRPTWIAHGPRSGERIQGVLGGFDHDGDGREDLLLTSTLWGGSSRGGFVVLPGQAAPTTPTRALCVPAPELGIETNALLGSAAAVLGDVDADGCDDVAIAARTEDLGVSNQGVVRVLWGGGSGCGRAPAVSTLVGGVANTQAGFGVAGGGDVDGDEIPDLVVGAPFVNQQGASVGAVWLTPGWYLLEAPRDTLTYGIRAEPTAIPVLPGGAGRALRGRDASGAFGRSVALLPDPAAPFRSVVAIGIPAGDTGSGTFTGGVEVYRYNRVADSFDPVPMAVVAGEAGGLGDLGATVLGVRGRKTWALLVGAPNSDVGGPDLGAAYAFPWVLE